MIKLYTDAATKGNNGIGGIGILVTGNGLNLQRHQVLGVHSNHEAEFLAAIAGFRYLKTIPITDSISFYSDSKLVIDALDKRYAKHYGTYVADLVALVESFPMVFWQWLPDHQNRGAHMLAQQGLHAAEKAQEKSGE